MNNTASPERRRSRTIRPVLLVMPALVVVVATSALVWLRHGEVSPTPVSVSSPSSSAPTASASPAYRVPCLGALAERVAGGTDSPSQGRYLYLRMRHLADQDGGRLMASDEEQWRADDRSGRLVRKPVPGNPSLPAARVDYGPGGMHGGLADPTVTDLPALAAQLSRSRPPVHRPEWLLRAVVDVYQAQWPQRPTRVAMLRLLAQTHGLRCERSSNVGVPTVVVSMRSEDGRTQDRLVIDASNAGPVAYRVTWVRTPPGAVRQEVTWLAHGRVDEIGAVPS
ncbi:hypothetical protein [Micromonospora sp. CPCC 206061]|uniref:hypothetical protein n=1 Tax=Micromonospora sp. CPCC 206061 TaxID=3122410 RepID=UPI002FEFBF24